MDHIGIPISDSTRTKVFYEELLAPLGWTCSGWRPGIFAAFKKPGAPALYFNVAQHVAQTHLAFKAQTQLQVANFHRDALEAGATDNGPPAPRPDYGQTYYAAFVLDPDGHNVEVVVGGVNAAP
jgi:catechol 2,3-dioxygenase-like lactoylglutathione lyase family enzyme